LPRGLQESVPRCTGYTLPDRSVAWTLDHALQNLTEGTADGELPELGRSESSSGH